MRVKIETLIPIREAYRAARETQGLTLAEDETLSITKWRRWLSAEESQIRVFQLRVRFEELPYWVHVHLVRHWVGFDAYEPFVRTQRPDGINPVEYNRGEAPQSAPTNMTVYCNPQGLINVSRRRLCRNASPETREVWGEVKQAIAIHSDPYVQVIAEAMMPDCEYRGGFCHMVKTCGMYPRRSR